jgi:hypothetical protein
LNVKVVGSIIVTTRIFAKGDLGAFGDQSVDPVIAADSFRCVPEAGEGGRIVSVVAIIAGRAQYRWQTRIVGLNFGPPDIETLMVEISKQPGAARAVPDS